jgi:23S rRNA pseudouridine1911/1915/1917 synthase
LLAHSPEAFLGWQGIGDVVRPGIVHRLDRETSGAMIVAKNNASHRCLTQEFAERRVYKEYWGWVWGHPRCRFGQIVTGFERHAVYRQRFTSKTTRGKKAHTEYKVICDAGPVSLVRFILHTGRTHQIRVHCADMGHPIVGDRVYGGCHKLAKAWGMHRHALHSRKLSIACDGSKTKKVCLVAPWPEDFQKIGQALGVSYGEGLEQ